MQRDATIDQDSQLKQQAHDFLDLLEMDWPYQVNAHANRTLNEKARNKVKFIPLVKDTMLLADYLKSTGHAAAADLEATNDAAAWMRLNEAALARVILFNRRCQGEASKLKVEDFRKMHMASQTDIMEGLSPLERKLCKELQRVEIVGKRGRTVPLLLTLDMTWWINLLIAKREIADVHQENMYVFARNHYGSLGHIRGSDILRDASQQCGAKEPGLLRSTKLRKQIGTLSQILNLKEHELDILADFIGHDIRVHREYYRLPGETLQVAKVSKLLLTLERGQYNQQKGRNLDEIEVDLEEDIDLEGVNSDDESTEDEPVTNAKDDTSSSEEVTDGAAVPIKRRRTKGPLRTKKRPWTESEKVAVLSHFDRAIALKKLPGKGEIDRCLSQEPALQSRTWRNVKDFVRNRITSKKSS